MHIVPGIYRERMITKNNHPSPPPIPVCMNIPLDLYLLEMWGRKGCKFFSLRCPFPVSHMPHTVYYIHILLFSVYTK